MRNTVDILGVPVDSVTMEQAKQKVIDYVHENNGTRMVFTPNSEILMAAQRDPGLKDILKNADLLVADGAGVVLAARILRLNIPEKVSGIDLVKNLLQVSEKEGLSYFLFGSKPGVAEAAGEKMKETYGNIDIKGYRNGYFSKEDEPQIVEQVNSSGADIILVALGAPKQEKWIYEYREALKAKVCIGIGGSLDVFAGNVKLAPDFFRNHGLEWLYRLCKEPRRYKRMLDLPRFIFRVIAVKLRLRK
ncbi:MAG: WecB/TagA/CpsF family glycosyltransferase [Bacillota bacterium]|nr:WecB/TagA/CpsF family glycosyltransferase [Bacillota bacterium]